MKSDGSRPGSSGSTSAAHSPTRPPQDMRAKAGEATSKITDAARQASGQAKQAASSLASDATKQAKGILNMQVTAGADMVDHVAESARAAAEMDSVRLILFFIIPPSISPITVPQRAPELHSRSGSYHRFLLLRGPGRFLRRD